MKLTDKQIKAIEEATNTTRKIRSGIDEKCWTYFFEVNDSSSAFVKLSISKYNDEWELNTGYCYFIPISEIKKVIEILESE